MYIMKMQAKQIFFVLNWKCFATGHQQMFNKFLKMPDCNFENDDDRNLIAKIRNKNTFK